MSQKKKNLQQRHFGHAMTKEKRRKERREGSKAWNPDIQERKK